MLVVEFDSDHRIDDFLHRDGIPSDVVAQVITEIEIVGVAGTPLEFDQFSARTAWSERRKDDIANQETQPCKLLLHEVLSLLGENY